MSEWHYSESGQQRGPVSVQTLKELMASGRLLPSDLVWTEGMPTWQPVAQVAELRPAGPSLPPPLPPDRAPLAYATPLYHQAPPLGDNAGVRWLLPVGRSGWAIAAGYLGLISVLLVPAPLALICAIIAIRDIKRHPGRHGMGRAIFGLIMGIIFTIALCAVFLGARPRLV